MNHIVIANRINGITRQWIEGWHGSQCVASVPVDARGLQVAVDTAKEYLKDWGGEPTLSDELSELLRVSESTKGENR